MTPQQLSNLQAAIAKTKPGYSVARGGILTNQPATGIQKITISGADCKSDLIEYDFDKEKIV